MAAYLWVVELCGKHQVNFIFLLLINLKHRSRTLASWKLCKHLHIQEQLAL